jgi:DnaK suppressor protein
MGPLDLQRYKRLLLEKQGELSSVQDETKARVPPAGASQGDSIDQATADAEAELQIRLHRSDGRLMRAIEDALARMTHGSFGVCTSCREPISKARLEAVPWTHQCRKCKERQAA